MLLLWIMSAIGHECFMIFYEPIESLWTNKRFIVRCAEQFDVCEVQYGASTLSCCVCISRALKRSAIFSSLLSSCGCLQDCAHILLHFTVAVL